MWRMVVRVVSGRAGASWSQSAGSAGGEQSLRPSAVWEALLAWSPHEECKAWRTMRPRLSLGARHTRRRFRSMFGVDSTARRWRRRQKGWSDLRASGGSWWDTDSSVSDAAWRPLSVVSGWNVSRSWRTSCQRLQFRRTRRCAATLSAMAANRPMIRQLSLSPSCTTSPSSSSSWRVCWTSRSLSLMICHLLLLLPCVSWILSWILGQAQYERRRHAPSGGCSRAAVVWSAWRAAHMHCRSRRASARLAGSTGWSLSRTSLSPWSGSWNEWAHNNFSSLSEFLTLNFETTRQLTLTTLLCRYSSPLYSDTPSAYETKTCSLFCCHFLLVGIVPYRLSFETNSLS